MPISQNQRLRKAAAKATKRKAVVAEKLARERRELSISKPRHIDFATSPIVGCTMTEGWETKGMGTLMVARSLSLGRYGVCVFLIDTWCVGVKDAFFHVIEGEDYEAYCEDLAAEADAAPIDVAQARKLLRDAAAYGAANGFPPPYDLPEIERIFGDVAPAETTFVFGDNGTPHYVASLAETPSRLRNALKRLEQKLGPNGFRFSEADEEDEGEGEYDYVDENGEIIEGEAIKGD